MKPRLCISFRDEDERQRFIDFSKIVGFMNPGDFFRIAAVEYANRRPKMGRDGNYLIFGGKK